MMQQKMELRLKSFPETVRYKYQEDDRIRRAPTKSPLSWPSISLSMTRVTRSGISVQLRSREFPAPTLTTPGPP